MPLQEKHRNAKQQFDKVKGTAQQRKADLEKAKAEVRFVMCMLALRKPAWPVA